jgi:hypothetical protein
MAASRQQNINRYSHRRLDDLVLGKKKAVDPLLIQRMAVQLYHYFDFRGLWEHVERGDGFDREFVLKFP